MRKRTALYVDFYENEKIDPQTVLYESYFGRGMVDNPYAIFKALLKDEEYKKLQHIWVVDNPEKDDYKLKHYNNYPNVKIVERHSDEYYRYLAKAGVLINNVTFPAMFIKKAGQVYINTWHGTPLKKMGYEMSGGNYGTRSMVRNFLHADYLLASNDVLVDMYLKSYKMENIMPGKILKEGYPRNDLLFNTNREELFDELEYYGVEFDRKKSIILYAPTWKQNEAQEVIIDADELMEFKNKLEAGIDTDRYQVLIKPHQNLYEEIKDREEFKGKLIPTEIDANELLSVVDILISDYSSIFYDYLALDRPILFYINNLEEYSESRGLNSDLSELPGPISASIGEIAKHINSIDSVSEEYRECRKTLREKICPNDDGSASDRIAECIFAGPDINKLVSAKFEKKKLLISIGLLRENGITNSALSLLKQIDYDEFDVTLYAAAPRSNENINKRINEDIDPHVRTMIRTGCMANTAQEETRRLFVESKSLDRPIWKSMFPYKAVEREYRRLFGGADFDYVVDFNGYGNLSAELLTCSKAARKAIWLHNDILADMNRTINGEKPIFHCLKFNISLYPEFDAMVSCGKTVMEVNRKNLATAETRDKFTYAKNTTNADRVRKLIGEDNTEGDKQFRVDKDKTNFITMGRMSVEKNHLALINAFSRYLEDYPDSCLYIIGTGPLQENIENRIEELDLKDKVILTGTLYNPFALMKQCDCFIMPSIHEGQPMVLLEARQCGLPIIVSDFSTLKDSLMPNGQYVIHSDEDSIYSGLCAFREGKVPQCEFDVDTYNQEAYLEFRKAVCGY